VKHRPVIMRGRSVRVRELGELGVVTFIREVGGRQLFEVVVAGTRRLECRRHELELLDQQEVKRA
jgi:hypothetical protein